MQMYVEERTECSGGHIHLVVEKAEENNPVGRREAAE
jgi:hypothetical protein